MVMSYTSMLELPMNQYLPMAVSYGAFQSGGLRFGRSLSLLCILKQQPATPLFMGSMANVHPVYNAMQMCYIVVIAYLPHNVIT